LLSSIFAGKAGIAYARPANRYVPVGIGL